MLSRKKLSLLTVAAGVMLVPGLLMVKARGSDHADTPAIAANPGVDLTDVFIFPSPADSTKVVLVMNVHPLIPSGVTSTIFDPDALYQFKIANKGDVKLPVENLVIQAKFTGTGTNQTVQIAGPVAPTMTGTKSVFQTPDPTSGTINTVFTTSSGIKVFAGTREDPFFFDLEAFFNVLPDRGTTIPPPVGRPAPANPNQPQSTTFNAPGVATDTLKGYNVLTIVLEMPRTMLTNGGDGTGKIRLWCTTSK
ncbi:MAG: hypothetical protein JWL77_3792 [Chthonomonadaceae bacterium]|nr:hypothetical protein [Chthonomonadaceae bacterium]